MSTHSETSAPVRRAAAQDTEQITFGEIGRIILARWKLVIFSTILCAVAATAVSYTMSPIYQAEALMVPADSDLEGKSQLGGLAGQLGELASFAGIGSGNNTKDEAIAILQSRLLTDRFVDERNLLPILFAGLWDADAKRWKVEDPKTVPTDWDAYKVISRIRKVVEDRRTGLVTLTLNWKDPVQASEWANELIERTNQYMRSKALAHSAANVNYLKDQLDHTSVVELRSTINSLIEGEMKKSMLASGSDEYAFKVVDPAVPPKEKYAPKRLFYLLGGLVIGFLMGLLIAFFKGLP